MKGIQSATTIWQVRLSREFSVNHFKFSSFGPNNLFFFSESTNIDQQT